MPKSTGAIRSLIHVSGAAGLDEAGRGPLAGPVTAAAVVIPDDFDSSGVDDSKRLSPAQRETLSARITSTCRWAVAEVEPGVIDEINILWAAMRAMEIALAEIDIPISSIFVDGNHVPKGLTGRAEPVIGGDGVYLCIAAASIVAKVARDARMRAYALEFPMYGFDRHYGYGTPEHLAALREHGPCALHRRSFAPVAQLELSLFKEEPSGV